MLRDAVGFHALETDTLPPEAELRRGIASVAENLEALLRAPVGEPYTGPVLFEPAAAAQLLAEVLGRNLRAAGAGRCRSRDVQSRSPTANWKGAWVREFCPSGWTWWTTRPQTEWRGRPLFGTLRRRPGGRGRRSPWRWWKGRAEELPAHPPAGEGRAASNGRARLRGSFGANAAASATCSCAPRRASTLRRAEEEAHRAVPSSANKPYGLLMRKMDFPSSASLSEAPAPACRHGARRRVSAVR